MALQGKISHNPSAHVSAKKPVKPLGQRIKVQPCEVCLQSQKLQNKSSSTRSATLQGRTEKACLDVLSRLDADLPLSAIQGARPSHMFTKCTIRCCRTDCCCAFSI